MRLLWEYMKERAWTAALLCLCGLLFALVLSLYDLPVEAVGYGAVLCLALVAVFTLVDFGRWRRSIRALEAISGQAALALSLLPEASGQKERDYQALLAELNETRRSIASAADARARETVDYYTMWVHQIKTPIAAMRLMLQEDDTDRGRELAAELFRVERYVELVLSYLRLGGDATDYVIRQADLDPILRQAARKYAPLFIRGRVSLDMQETGLRALTDEKWLQLVVEQVLSNAVKYAPGGHVKIWGTAAQLFIEDDGVGIAPEDLPRIFDRGFTGCNGRMDKRATGIGLYLCRQICRRLGHTIGVDSELGRGTRVTIGLARPYLEVE